MRTIKFRGKRVDNGEWVYGDLLQYRVLPVIFDKKNVQREVFETTVGQFTGLYDKNGQEIYEGDIIKATNKYNGGTTIGKVYFEDFTLFGAKDYLDYVNKFCLIEVIGNIHDID